MTDHDHFNEQLIPYALDALDPSEARDLERHLRACNQCQSELGTWRETSAHLAWVAEEFQPRAYVRDRILADVRNTKLESQPATLPPNRYSSDSYRPSVTLTVFPWWRTAPGITAIAACIALMIVSISLFQLWRRERDVSSQLTLLTKRLDDQDNELARVKEQNELLSDPNVHAIVLSGTNMAPNANAKIMFDSKTGRSMLVAYNLPSAPAGKAYQLWFIAGGKPLPGHTFTPDRNGRAMMEYEVPEAGRHASLFAVTLEPEAGVASPTGDKYLLSAAS